MPAPFSRPATASAADPGTRARTPAWRTLVPTGFVLLVLAALVLLPFVNAAYMEPAREQIRRYADPARAAVTQIHVALALEGSVLDDFIETRDPALERRYRDAVAQEEGATRRLGALVAQLGDTARARYDTVRRLQAAWHAVVERGLAPALPGAPRVDPLRGDEYEDLLLGVAHLDAAIGEEIRQSRRHIQQADRAQRWTTALLALAGLAGAGAVALLAWRVQRYAVEADERRAELERVVESRARLMRGLSHDLKNPLHAIDGHAALLADGLVGELTPAQANSVARIRRGVRSVLSLVDDLLELSRAEAGQLRVKPQPTDLAALLRETVEEHRAAARAAGHEVALSIDDGLPTPRTDPERVRQVIGNLLSNAVKYTPTGGRIAVRAERRARVPASRRDGWVAVDVEDTGPGIPADKLDVIFEEFARLPAHVGKPGVGLGLAIARRVARLLGGDLTAQSEQRGGARFTLWLPGEGHPWPGEARPGAG